MRVLIYIIGILLLLSAKCQDNKEYLSVGYGVTYGLYQRQYDDEMSSFKSNNLQFRPVVINLRYGNRINESLDFIVNMQYAWFSQLSDDIVEGISNWVFTAGGKLQKGDRRVYYSAKAGFVVVRKAVGGTLIPGIGYSLSDNWNLELEGVFAQTIIDYNFTNYGLADARLTLQYSF